MRTSHCANLFCIVGHLGGAEVEFERLPAPRGFRSACRELGLESGDLLVNAGEDYELLFALAPKSPLNDPVVLREKLGVPVTEIGRVIRGSGIRGLPPSRGGHHF